MEFIVLGSGAFVPARRGEVRNPAGYAVKLGRDILIFDFGFGNFRQLFRAGLDPANITDVFLTHRHPDHVGDLAALLFAFRYDVKPKSGRLRVWGPAGFMRFWKDLEGAYKPWLSPKGYDLRVREIGDGGKVSGKGWEVRAAKVPHPTPALAYRLFYKGKSLVYSGDTGLSPTLARFAAGADLFVIECTMPERRPYSGHLRPSEALAILEASGCRRGLLTHISGESEPEIKRLVKRQKRVGMARDLLRLRL